MANLEGTDQFIIRRNGEYYTAKFDTVVDGIEAPLAQQGDAYTGKAGKIIPSNNFLYDNDTGVLDIDLPQTMAFKGVIDQDYASPSGTEINGDIYLVNVDPDDLRGYLVLNKADWNQAEGLVDVTLMNRGTEYKGDTGPVTVFGDGVEIALQNVTNPGSSFGLRLSTRLQAGYIVASETKVEIGGTGYSVDDIIRIKQYSPNIFDDDCTYIQVTAVASGAVTGFKFIRSQSNTGEDLDELQGDGLYYVHTGEMSSKRNVAATGRNTLVTGTDLTVDITCHLGEIVDAQVSNLSGHKGFNDGDRVFVYNHNIRNVGDGELMVSVNTDPSQTFTVANNDKLIYAIEESAEGDRSRWFHIKDSTSAVSVTEITTKAYPYDDPDFSNSQASLEIVRNPINRNQYQIAIRNAKFVDGGGGLADPFLSHAGLMTPEDKDKLDTVTRGVSGVGSNFHTNSETGQSYKILDIGTVDETQFVNIKINDADVGKRGVVSISSDASVTSEILDHHTDGDTPVNTAGEVMATSQVVQNFAPNNFYLLPAVQ